MQFALDLLAQIATSTPGLCVGFFCVLAVGFFKSIG